MGTLPALGLALALVSPLAAAAADSPAPAKPLRTLIYDVSYSASTSHERMTSGFNAGYGGGGAGDGAPAVSSGSGNAGAMLNGDSRGRLTIDIVAATSDSGLVVDTAFAGPGQTSPPKVRVAIFSDGRLSAPPSAQLSPETIRILPLLARGFIAERNVAPGQSWSVSPPPPFHGSTTYRVQRLDGPTATLVLEGHIVVGGASGFDENDNGTATYQTDLVNPLALELTARIRRQLGVDESTTTNAHLTATLVSDTFSKR